MKAIPKRYFDELLNYGSVVPRDEKTGDVIPFVVGKEYIIYNKSNKDTVSAVCTQDCPYNLKKVDS